MEEFRFKQFALRHDRSAQKVGTDGVLLGAWAHPGEARKILDAGTGCGLIALMMAQKTREEVAITGVDADHGSILDAQYNKEHSPWSDRLSFHECALEEHSGSYDHILSNPPFFLKSLSAPDARRSSARHLGSVSQWLQQMERLSADSCTWSLIVDYPGHLEWQDEASKLDFMLRRKTTVHSKASKPAERVLMEFERPFSGNSTLDTLVLLEEADGRQRTADYRDLCVDFYLS